MSRRAAGGWRELQRTLRDAAARPGSWLIGLDFDGTLSPLARRPDLARLTEPTRRLLVRLARSPEVSLAFISGRSLRDIVNRIGLRGARYAGNHGLEIRGPGAAWRHPKAVSAAADLRALSRGLGSAVKAFPGAFVEDKRLTLSVHHRGMAPRHEEALAKLLARSLTPFALRLKLARGKKTWEVRPRASWNKGNALLKIARSLGRLNHVLFVGDDRTDEEGFRVLGPRAVTVKVGGAGKTAARFRLRRQGDVVRLLERLCRLAMCP